MLRNVIGGTIGGSFSCYIARKAFLSTHYIDVRPNSFCSFLSVKKKNFIIFDRYEYWVDPKIEYNIKCQRFSACSIHPIEFVRTDEEFNKLEANNELVFNAPMLLGKSKPFRCP